MVEKSNRVVSTVIEYKSSTSGTTPPTGTWQSTIPSVAAGSYLWTRTTITYTDETTSTIYCVGKMGNTGTAAGFGTPTASAKALSASAAPTVTVTASGTNTAKVFNFEFGIPKGDGGSGGSDIAYETGTWTPSFNIPSEYIDYISGTYTLIGNQCTIEGVIICSDAANLQNLGSIKSLRFSGLPFTAKNYQLTDIGEDEDNYDYLGDITYIPMEWRLNSFLVAQGAEIDPSSNNIYIFTKTHNTIGSATGEADIFSYLNRSSPSYFKATYEIS